MGDPLAKGPEGQEGGHGRRGRLVRPGRRSEYRASSVAVCESGGEEGEEGDELGGGGVGGYGAQDCAADSEDEVEDLDPYALESCRMRRFAPKGGRGRGSGIRFVLYFRRGRW